MDSQYPANSDRSKEAAQQSYQKRVEGPVVNGNVTRKERSVWGSIAEFFGLGECRSFRDYVGAVSDMTNRVYGAIDTLLGNRKYQNTTVPGARIQYSGMYNPQTAAPQTTAPQPQATQTGMYGQYYITYDLRQDAEVVLAKMFELLHIYRNVSVGDMFDLAGISSPNGYTDMKYGWRSLDGAQVIPFGSKWVINLPAAIQI